MKLLYITLILAVCLVMSCATIEYGDIKYTRYGSQKLDDVLIEVVESDGTSISVIIEGQKSEFELALQAAGIGAKIGGGI